MILKLFFLVITLLVSSEVFAQVTHQDSFEITSIEIQGNDSTKKETLIEILPRDLPTLMSKDEISEYSRRIKNLGIFDFVKVSRIDKKLFVTVRKKVTLSPILDISSGKTLKDTSAKIGLNEYDFLGDGTKLGGQVSYNDRNLNFMLWFSEHNYRNHRWSREYEIYMLSSSFRFDDAEDDAWTRNRLGAAFEVVSPFKYDSPLLYEFQIKVYNETYSNVNINANLESAVYFGSLFEVIYDRYNWDDLHPHGFKGAIEMRPGVMSDGEFRGEAVAKCIAATPLGNTTSLVANAKIATVNSGNVNHSLLIGSQSGVRGLNDSYYRNSVQGYLNLEIRHTIEIYKRTFIQPVLFMDAARFLPMDEQGNNTEWVNALSTGAGVRVIPTGFTNLLFRADIGRLHTPSEDWVFQFGITQYF